MDEESVVDIIFNVNKFIGQFQKTKVYFINLGHI